jgi:hypothetical protein
MFRVPSISGLFKWRQFEPEVILLAVGWYLRFSLSYRERGGVATPSEACTPITSRCGDTPRKSRTRPQQSASWPKRWDGRTIPVPRVINTDGHSAYPPATVRLKAECALNEDCRHRPGAVPE